MKNAPVMNIPIMNY